MAVKRYSSSFSLNEEGFSMVSKRFTTKFGLRSSCVCEASQKWWLECFGLGYS